MSLEARRPAEKPPLWLCNHHLDLVEKSNSFGKHKIHSFNSVDKLNIKLAIELLTRSRYQIVTYYKFLLTSLVMFINIKLLGNYMELFNFRHRRKGRRKEILLLSLSNGNEDKNCSQSNNIKKSLFLNSVLFLNITYIIINLLSLILIVPNGLVSLAGAESTGFYEEPQPLIYIHESGSGKGFYRNSASFSNELTADSSSSISPELIAAKCWNNYENDDDCKHINFITAPNSQDQTRQLNQPINEEDDSLITPVVIFESSSTVEPAQMRPASSGGVGHLAPPYFSSTPASDLQNIMLTYSKPITPTNENYFETTERPTTSSTQVTSVPLKQRPAPGGVYVATPMPKWSKEKPKSTTSGRKCRDENDEDCDEPEESSSNDKEDDDEDDDKDKNNDKSSASLANSSEAPGWKTIAANDENGDQQIGSEFGSGTGPTQDDNEDDDSSTDDDEGNLESSGVSDQPNGNSGADLTTTRYVEVSSLPFKPTTLQPSSTTNRQPGAEIEVVVHSTLPPNFSVQPGELSKGSSAFTTTNSTTTTTIMPDDTYTSRPIFPTTTPASPETTKDSAKMDSNISQSSVGADESLTSITTDAELDTFRPIPMPAPEIDSNHLRRQHDSSVHTLDNRRNGSDFNGGQVELNEGRQLSERHKFDPNAPIMKFSNPWLQSNRQQPAQLQPSSSNNDPWASKASSRVKQPEQRAASESNQRKQSEILSTLLLYASIIILTTTVLIFIVMAFAFWRRNNARQRAFMRHKQNHLIDGGNLVNQMVGSMSHGSQLVANLQQPGLLSTYAPSKVGMSMMNGKVTSSIAKADEMATVEEEDSRILNMDQFKELIDDRVNLTNATSRRNQNASWSTDEPTLSSGSQRTNESQQMLTSHQQNDPTRQNSSSISVESECSPDEANGINQRLLGPIDNQQIAYEGSQPIMPPVANNNGYLHNHPMQNGRKPVHLVSQANQYEPNLIQNPIISSRSFEDVHRMQQQQLGPYDASHQLQLGPIGPNQPPPIYPKPSIPVNVQRAYIPPGQFAHINGNNGLNLQQPKLLTNDLIRYQRPPSSNDLHFATASPSTRVVQMNPFATMGRRYVPGNGLNRNIYSEDSSSFMTTSPSLARTSSSSSFAFNTSTTTARVKGPIDSSGRPLNDYDPNFNHVPNSVAPPVSSRKDHSEAWYV